MPSNRSKVISLEAWFRRSMVRPLAAGVAVAVLLFGLLIGKTLVDYRRTQREGAARVAELAGLALAQKNRVLLESVLDASRWQLDALGATLCRDSRPLVSSSSEAPGCSSPGSESESVASTRIERVAVPGFDGHEVRLRLPGFPRRESFAAILALGVALLASYLLLIGRAHRRLSRELLKPLETELSTDAPLPIRELERLRASLREVTDLRVATAVAEAVLQRNRQIAHDIRSPLAALGVATRVTAQIPEEARDLIRSAVSRIQDIAGQLATSPGPTAAWATHGSKPMRAGGAQLLGVLIDSVLTEKRVQYVSRLSIDIESDLDQAYGLFGAVHPADFKRVLSNLVDNAVEAIEGSSGSGRVVVRLLPAPESTIVEVEDTGPGIPEKILPVLFQSGATFGKERGSGLGLFHARESVRAWGGEIEAKSSPGNGTMMRVTLPRAEAPRWFLPRVELPPSQPIAILDDDPSIHRVWTQRLTAELADASRIRHFTSSRDFRDWLGINEAARRGGLFLMDYELAGETSTGLDVVEECGIGGCAVLVTSHFEEEAILKRCERLGVRVIPKSAAGLVPVGSA